MSSERQFSRRACSAACAFVLAAVGSAQPSAAEVRAVDRLERHCVVSWRNANVDRREWPDLTQQAILGLLERVGRGKLVAAVEDHDSPERRELNRAIWRTLKRWQRSPRLAPLDEGATIDRGPSGDPNMHADRDFARWLLDQLPTRQRTIVDLWTKGESIQAIASKLALPAARVSDEKYKAIRKLKQLVDALESPNSPA